MQTNEAAEQAAITAANNWLAVADAGDYAQCWLRTSSLFKDGVQTSSLFKRGVSRQQWQSSVAEIHARLGKAERRSVKSRRYADKLPGEPEGEYVVIEYETYFESHKRGREVVNLLREQDGEWRVSEYRLVLANG